jgi:hypothetical protein
MDKEQRLLHFLPRPFKSLLFSTLLVVVLSTLLLPGITQAQTAGSIYDPSQYKITFFKFFPSLGIKLSNGIPDVLHQGAITVSYGTVTNIDFIIPPEVLSGKGRLFYIDQNGVRHYEYTFYDQSHIFIPPPYTWTKAGQYEVDILGTTATLPSDTYLTTLSFSVVMVGGPAPTCTLSASPSTLYPKQGNDKY